MLLLGDFHIPQKCNDIPEQFKELLQPGKIQHVLCTGNIGNPETKAWLESLAPHKENAVFVKGDIDEGVCLRIKKLDV